MTKQKQHPKADDPVLVAASEAIGNMITLLTEAQDDVERQWRVYSGRAAMPGFRSRWRVWGGSPDETMPVGLS